MVGFEAHPEGDQKNGSGGPRQLIVAQEDDSENEEEDHIPGPIGQRKNASIRSNMDLSSSMDMSSNYRKGAGILASVKDLNLPSDEFADGCKLLQQAALGNQVEMEKLLLRRPKHVDFRDYDRRTALHVAASEGHVAICRFLVKKGARINRSDRWGGSPLDDGHRHRHQGVIHYLRQQGATTGSSNFTTNLITAAAEGDFDEVKLLLAMMDAKSIDIGDYDKRTALHLASGEGHAEIVQLLCDAGANPNAQGK